MTSRTWSEGGFVVPVGSGDVVIRAADLRALLDVAGGGAPCHRDHHGGCQTHNMLDLDPGDWCPVAFVRALLDAHDSDPPSRPDGSPFTLWACSCGFVWDRRTHTGPCPRCQLARATS